MIPTTNDVYMGGRGNVPENAGISVSHKLFAPRVGIAYRLGENTVIRAGYGLNYDPIPFSRPLRGFYPLTINAETKSPNSFSFASTLAEGIPPVPLPDISTGIVPLPARLQRTQPVGIHSSRLCAVLELHARAQAAARTSLPPSVTSVRIPCICWRIATSTLVIRARLWPTCHTTCSMDALSPPICGTAI